MEITMEQVKKLQEHADVSFREAKAALEGAGGNLLEALIALEAQGKARPGGGSYRTDQQYAAAGQAWERCEFQRRYERERRAGWFRRLWQKARELFHKGNVNHFEAWRGGNQVVVMPVNLLIIVLVLSFWVVVPVLAAALFFGFRYRFRGPDLERETINGAMDKVSNAAESIKRSVNGDDGTRDGENSTH
ncbi:MAG: DUF4342 domain-containing protein [Gracilibacteraceae bacterium]|jgi:hypothetical protein|nr:DUF4342 domain-containing protein [Gracilibacteraceae bacterium]